jgi:hypothetical protein
VLASFVLASIVLVSLVLALIVLVSLVLASLVLAFIVLASLVLARSLAQVQAAAALKSIVASPMRFVAVSATMPNIQDVGAFLQCKSDSIFSFDESYRPVPLQTVVKACGNSKNQCASRASAAGGEEGFDDDI